MRVETKTNPNRTIALIVLLIVFLSVTIFTITERHTVIAFKPTSNLTGESTSTPQPHQQISPGSMTCDSQLCFVRAWGYEGTGNGQFNGTLGIAIDPSGDTYVTDTDNNLVQKFTSNGTFITKWGGAGTADGQFGYPDGVAVDSSGDVYVADSNNNRIQKFTSDGTFITKWGKKGTADGQFDLPSDVAVDSSGNVYVSDINNDRIQKFTSNGTFITKWGAGNEGFFDLEGIAVDSSGDVYAADQSRILKFTSDGTLITKWGEEGNDEGEFNYVTDVAVDSSGDVYVSDSGNNRIQVFGQVTG